MHVDAHRWPREVHDFLESIVVARICGGRRSIFLSGGDGDELQVHMEAWENGVRGGAPEKFCNPHPIIQWETPCLNIDMHTVLVENGR